MSQFDLGNTLNPEETVLFLDAFDEDTKAIIDHHARIGALMEACRKFKRVVITCRTQFFPKDEEIPVETGVARIDPRKAGEKGTYEFWKLYLSPFDDEDVKQYLARRYPIWSYRQRKKAQAVARKIPLLCARPMLLAHIPDVVASGGEIRFVSQLYEAMTEAWVERESSWADKNALREFSERLAVDVYVNRESRGSESVPYSELSVLAQQWGLDLKQWQMSGRSLLNRDAQGNYKFSHRSIVEYLFALRLVHGDERCYGEVLTDQMKRFLVEILAPITAIYSDDAYQLLANFDVSARGLGEYRGGPVVALDPGARQYKTAPFLADLTPDAIEILKAPAPERGHKSDTTAYAEVQKLGTGNWHIDWYGALPKEAKAETQKAIRLVLRDVPGSGRDARIEAHADDRTTLRTHNMTIQLMQAYSPQGTLRAKIRVQLRDVKSAPIHPDIRQFANQFGLGAVKALLLINRSLYLMVEPEPPDFHRCVLSLPSFPTTLPRNQRSNDQ